MRKVGLILGLALVLFACSEQAGQMLVDAGEMMMDASVPDAGAQTGRLLDVPCDGEAHGFQVSDPKTAQVEVCGYEAGTGDPGDCLYGHTFRYTDDTIYVACSTALPLTFRLFE